MKYIVEVSFLVLAVFCSVEGTKNYIGTEIQKCINCLCHARTGCWRRANCASYSIDEDYWRTAGSPTVSPDEDPEAVSSYTNCMKNENCIVATIVKYTEQFGEVDCNCDGVFDCKDRFAIHLFGAACANPNYGKTYTRRFNECAASLGVDTMIAKEGSETCEVRIF